MKRLLLIVDPQVDFIYGSGMFNVLSDFSPSIDGGTTLDKTITENRLKCNR